MHSLTNFQIMYHIKHNFTVKDKGLLEKLEKDDIDVFGKLFLLFNIKYHFQSISMIF